jgi:hypothetical protein
MRRRSVPAAHAVEFERDWRERRMTILVIALLAIIGYLCTRLFSAVSEISTLRAHVATLKRRLHER